MELRNSFGPLGDVRVLAVEQYGAGPWATLQLADLGAEVIKIEDARAGGDVGRYVPPYQEGQDSLFFETFNGAKKSIALDLRNPAGREALLRLVAESDAIFSNLRGDMPAKLGLRYADLAAHNPRIVCCSLSGFGQDGPRASAGALDYVIQGLAGWMTLTGEPGAPPTKTGLSLVDFAAGYVAAIALLGGIWRARRDGVGCDCDISLHETALHLLTYVGTWTATKGYDPQRRAQSAHPSVVPFQNFETADGWIVVACPKQHLWERLCKAIDRTDLLADPAFADMALRNANRDRLVPELASTFREHDTAAWLDRLAVAGVPSGPVNDVPTALGDAHVRAREAIERYEHPTFGAVRRLRSPLRLSDHRPEPQRAPRLGEHTRATLHELAGYTEAEIDQLEQDGAFGTTPS